MIWDLRVRDRQPELMDEPGLDAGQHRRALGALRRVNYFSRTAKVMFRALRPFVPADGSALRVLDLATGGGDVALNIARQARQANVPLHISGCDISATAVAVAQSSAQQAGLENLRFFQFDVLHDALPPDYDVIVCSLFLHHLTDEQAVGLVGRMAEAARRGVVIDDLRRTQLGYVLAWTVSRILTRSHIVHSDGPQSVRAAFSRREAEDLARRAGLPGAIVRRHWPQRFLLSWSKPACPAK